MSLEEKGFLKEASLRLPKNKEDVVKVMTNRLTERLIVLIFFSIVILTEFLVKAVLRIANGETPLTSESIVDIFYILAALLIFICLKYIYGYVDLKGLKQILDLAERLEAIFDQRNNKELTLAIDRSAKESQNEYRKKFMNDTMTNMFGMFLHPPKLESGQDINTMADAFIKTIKAVDTQLYKSEYEQECVELVIDKFPKVVESITNIADKIDSFSKNLKEIETRLDHVTVKVNDLEKEAISEIPVEQQQKLIEELKQ